MADQEKKREWGEYKTKLLRTKQKLFDEIKISFQIF